MSKIIAELQMCNGMQPEIEPGDILIIDADSESVKDGDIALLLLDGNRAVRFFRCQGSGSYRDD